MTILALVDAPDPARYAIGSQLLTALDLVDAPAAECLGCGTSIPARQVWCSQHCRNFDDPHDS